MVPDTRYTKDEHPDYRMFSGKFEIGAGWEKVQEGTGLLCYSVRLDDPALTGPLHCAMFKTDGG